MKLTTKLLLGATLVAGLSISAFAACATDVDFGGTKKITGLADGSADRDAVNMAQVLKYSTVTVADNNSTGLTTTGAKIEKIGGICIYSMSWTGNIGSLAQNQYYTLPTAPVGYRPYGTSNFTWTGVGPKKIAASISATGIPNMYVYGPASVEYQAWFAVRSVYACH